MREESTLRLQGSWGHAEPPDPTKVEAALAPFGVELAGAVEAGPGELRIPLLIPMTVDHLDVADAVVDALELPSPRIRFEHGSGVRGIAGSGYHCSCGGVDGDHVDGCPGADA
ncbi:hypothetical protein ABGB12_10330 [Actinocorallia sp. B10E7]|uniref:hypothetical protein n=1 Tax=Actinocorallia sp. B10E7 TaxID=3153558 RepID=UPI00325CEF09